jgi:hypothetical protein
MTTSKPNPRQQIRVDGHKITFQWDIIPAFDVGVATVKLGNTVHSRQCMDLDQARDFVRKQAHKFYTQDEIDPVAGGYHDVNEELNRRKNSP